MLLQSRPVAVVRSMVSTALLIAGLTILPSSAQAGNFGQAVRRGQDPRISHRGSYYYKVYSNVVSGGAPTMSRTTSLVDPGFESSVTLPNNFPLMAPVYIGTLNGTSYNAWFAIGGASNGASVWKCNCADPWANYTSWTNLGQTNLGTSGNGTGLPPMDFEIFQNPQSGSYQNNWYLLWVSNNPGDVYTTDYREEIFISQITNLTAGSLTVSPATGTGWGGNLIVGYHGWTGPDVEAPGVFISGQDVNLVYSGNGAEYSSYGLGVALLAHGANPLLTGSWIDYSRSGNGYTNYNCGSEAQIFSSTSSTAPSSPMSYVQGPGVARFVPSPDGTQQWMYYEAKIFNTGTANTNENWARYLAYQKISTQTVSCGGQNYTLINPGVPQPIGASVVLPSGDAGCPTTGSVVHIEAEYMIPFTNSAHGVLSPSRISTDPTSWNADVLLLASAAASNGASNAYFPDLADGSSAGLITESWYGSSSITIVYSTTLTGQSAILYCNGSAVNTVNFANTGNWNTFQATNATFSCPAGSSVYIMPGQINIDYVESHP
jgi:hypothetical protein